MANNYIHTERLIKYSSSIYKMIGTGNPDAVTPSQYRLMRLDPFLKMGIWLVKSPILYAEHFIETPKDQSAGLSEEIINFLDEEFIKPHLYTSLYNALLGIDFGYSLQELIWVKKDGHWVFRTLIPADPDDVAYIKPDEWGGYDGATIMNATGRTNVAPQYTWLWIYQYEYGNYFGTSILKPAYQYWYDGQIVKLNLLRHLEKRGSDLLFILFPPMHNEANDGFQFAGSATDIADKLAYRKDVIFPNIVDEDGNSLFKVESIGSTTEGEGFVNALSYCDRAKLLSLLIPPELVVQGDAPGSYAAHAVKGDLLLSTINGIRQSIEEGLNKHVINKLVKVNFGKDAEAYIKLLPVKADISSLQDKIVTGVISKGMVSAEVNDKISYYTSSLFPDIPEDVIKENLKKEEDQEKNIEDLKEDEDSLPVE